MSYHIYQTEGFVISSIPVSEANRYISIYTEELGLVRAIAQGVRNLRSKLKHSLQDLSYTKISFVRGRDVWRIVNAEKLTLIEHALKDREKKVFIAKIAALIKRFVRGEERDEFLFKEIKNGLHILDNEGLTGDYLSNFEIIFVLRILKILGYVSDDKNLKCTPFFDSFDKNQLNLTVEDREKIMSSINNAMTHSHL
ncbi:MAG: DNA repair protein RecO [bacterium]